MSALCFTNTTLKFLRALKSNNDREWFRVRKTEYEQHVRKPMVEIINQLAVDLPLLDPELIASPKLSMYRVYRDTRFSPDKTPLKTHVSAVFPHRELTKHGGASLYFHVATDHVLVGGGIFSPEARHLYSVREHVAANFKRLQSIVESPAFHRSFGGISGERLQRVPRGFGKEHEASEYLKFKQFLAGRQHPSTFATGPRFYSSLLRLFERLVPFIRFLNEPLVSQAQGQLPMVPQPRQTAIRTPKQPRTKTSRSFR